MTLSAEDRRSAMDALLLRPGSHTRNRYIVMMVLSVVIATMGLLQNSSAVVIGAMMIAPLMAPIMGSAASMVMGWGSRLLTSGTYVVLSIAGAIALSWALARFMPVAVTGIPIEVLARSSPDIRDLIVALAAGTAGAYAIVRRDVSGALPGVAVAVALVPPLAAVGVLLGLDQPDLARGAALLFAANLFGILLAAAIVLLVTGFVPSRVRSGGRAKIASVLVVILIPVAVVAIILTQRFIHTADDARVLRAATEAAQSWLGPAAGDELGTIRLVGEAVEVNVSGPTPTPATQELSDALAVLLGQPMGVSVRWTPVRDGGETAPPAVVLPLDDVQPVVESWLEPQGLRLEGLSYAGGSLIVDTAGPTPPGESGPLQEAISAAFGDAPTVSLAWTQEQPEQEVPEPAPVEVLDAAAVAEQATRQWADTVEGVSVLGADGANGRISVTLVSAVPPDVSQLESQLAAALPEQTVTIRWLPSTQLSSTSSVDSTSSAFVN